MQLFFSAFILLLATAFNNNNVVLAIEPQNTGISQTDNDVFFLEHSIDTDDFKEIAKLNLRTIRQNQNSAQYQNIHSSAASTSSSSSSSSSQDSNEETNEHRYAAVQPEAYATHIESNDFDAETNQQLLDFKLKLASAESDINTLYRLRLCKRGVPAITKLCYVSTFTYLKSLLAANMRLNLTVYTGVNNQLNSMAVTVKVNGGGGSSTTASKSKIDSKKATTNTPEKSHLLAGHLDLFVSIQNMKTASLPDTETYLEKVKKETENKERGAQGGNESFLSKYWIYIVPFMIVMFLMNLANPEGGAPGGAR
jgi:hypothetical protein